jgi:outer membrane protein assembly factor BamD (BamD/ComL family)
MSLSLIQYVYVAVILYANTAYGGEADINDAEISRMQANQSKSSFDHQMNELNREMEAFKYAMKSESVSAMQDFISLYPTSSFIEMANSTIERLQYKIAEDKNTIDAYNHYLNEYPENDYTEKAAYKRSVLINTINEYDSYLTKYPNGNWKKRILFKRARLIDTVDEYNEILLHVWPNDDNVIYYRDKAALKEAKAIGNKDAFKSFIENYPNSAWIDQAKYFYEYGYDPD